MFKYFPLVVLGSSVGCKMLCLVAHKSFYCVCFSGSPSVMRLLHEENYFLSVVFSEQYLDSCISGGKILSIPPYHYKRMMQQIW